MRRISRVRRIAALIESILFFAFTAALFTARSVDAQVGTGSIVGQVLDESGATLPGVTVIASSPALQLEKISVVTDDRGDYRLTPLPIGTYMVEYSLSGFQSMRHEGVRLSIEFTARYSCVWILDCISRRIHLFPAFVIPLMRKLFVLRVR